jgi:hypothetical protein
MTMAVGIMDPSRDWFVRNLSKKSH